MPETTTVEGLPRDDPPATGIYQIEAHGVNYTDHVGLYRVCSSSYRKLNSLWRAGPAPTLLKNKTVDYVEHLTNPHTDSF